MLKQILAKIPRKSTKTDSLNPIEINSCDENSNTNSGNASQFINTCTVLPSRLNVMKRIFPSGGGEPLLPFMPFKDVSNAEKPNLFVLKLNFCCLVYNFSDPSKNSTEKEIKFQILSELNEFVGSGSAKFTEAAIAAVCKMCASNLFRDFPPKNNYLNIDEEPLFDPAWTHLQLVYDFLLEVLSQNSLDPKVAKKYINQTFILKLLDLFDSEDPRERECLKSILHRLYGKLMMTRPLIRKTVSNILYRFVFETQRHNGVSELLEVFGSVISGFALPLKEEHRIFLTKALIPLHKPKCLGVYHQQLSYCIIQFVEKDQKLASVVIKGLLKYWPVTNSQKELMFISELEEVLEMINMSDFEIIMVPLFRRIGFCLNSSHIQVAERAHYLWNNDHILNLTMHHRGIIMPIIFSALEKNSRNHWNKAVLNLTHNVRKVFFEMDEELALSCQSKLEDEISKVKMEDEKRRLTWESLETAAKFQQLPIILSSITEPVTTTCVVAC